MRTTLHSPRDCRVRCQKLHPDNALGNLKNAHQGLKILYTHYSIIMLLTYLKLYCNVVMLQTRYEDEFC